MEKSDRDISEWDRRLKQQLERSFHNYHNRRIDLSVARDNEQLDWTGEIIIVEKASSSDATATIRLMFDDADLLTLEKNVEIRSIFNRLFITNTAQAGEWLDVIAGINFEYKKKIDVVNFVDSGDVEEYDYEITDLDLDGMWHDLDLSDKIPIGTVAVLFNITSLRSSDAPRGLNFKTKGVTNEKNVPTYSVSVANMNFSAQLQVVPNADRMICYKGAANFNSCNLTITSILLAV